MATNVMADGILALSWNVLETATRSREADGHPEAATPPGWRAELSDSTAGAAMLRGLWDRWSDLIRVARAVLPTASERGRVPQPPFAIRGLHITGPICRLGGSLGGLMMCRVTKTSAAAEEIECNAQLAEP
jgi:hypothetical protein